MSAPFPPPLTPVDTTATGWLPLAPVEEVRAAMPLPLRVIVAGRPWALVDLDGEIVALHDVCPHRRVPLSAGRVAPGPAGASVLECGYHGWSYDRDGTCARIPALGEDVVPRGMGSVSRMTTAADAVMVWGCPDDPVAAALPATDMDDVFLREQLLQADADEVAATLGVVDTTSGGIHLGNDDRGPLRFALRPVSAGQCALFPVVRGLDLATEVSAWVARIAALPFPAAPSSPEIER